MFIKNFPYAERIILCKGAISQFRQKIMTAYFFQHISHIAQPVIPIHRIVLPRQRFLYIDNCINTKSSQSFLQPPVHHRKDLFPYFRILPVQIWLLLMKQMQIIFIRMSRQRFPAVSTEITANIGWQFAILYILYVKILSIFPVRILTCFFEPFMFIGTMIDYQIHDDTNISFLCFCQKQIHVIHISE